jgi:hypothetical protein
LGENFNPTLTPCLRRGRQSEPPTLLVIVLSSLSLSLSRSSLTFPCLPACLFVSRHCFVCCCLLLPLILPHSTPAADCGTYLCSPPLHFVICTFTPSLVTLLQWFFSRHHSLACIYLPFSIEHCGSLCGCLDISTNVRLTLLDCATCHLAARVPSPSHNLLSLAPTTHTTFCFVLLFCFVLS